MYHLGDPCIHCKQPHDDVEPGFCPQASGLAANIRNIEYLSALLAEHEKFAAEKSENLKQWIAEQRTIVSRVENGLDQDQIALAETIMYVSEYSRGGDERNSARQDAIKWFATGTGGYRGLKHEYFGTKNYDRWHGQRINCEYGMGPSHGSVVFQIGLKPEARERDLTDAEREAAVYFLVNLERIQAATVKAAE